MTVFVGGWTSGDNPGKGRWKRIMSDGKVTATITCPKCGGFGSLANHEIAADGTVTPSLVCPWTKELGCDYHDMGKLEGWRP
jgi:hypothetical protein